MRISAVIPAHDAAAWLPEAVASIRAQTRPVDEILIVDDGSSDDTAGVAAGLGADIRCLHQPHAGTATALNHAITEADGDWVAFLRPGALWAPQKTAEQLACLERHPELGLIASAATPDPGLPADGAPLPRALATLLRCDPIDTSTVMANRELLAELGGLDPELGEHGDIEFWARVARAHPVACLPRAHLQCAAAEATPSPGERLRIIRRIRAWGGAVLRTQGVNPDHLVAECWAEVAGWYLERGERDQARQAYWSSLYNRRRPRTLALALACRLPAPLLERLRRGRWLGG